MQITVKEVKVVAHGKNNRGDWELIRVTAEDGSEHTTFDKKAKHITTGSVIEIEPEVSDGKSNFKEFTIISEAPATTGDNGSDMSKDDWTEKNRIERESIEAQSAYKGVPELVETLGKYPENELALEAKRWAMSKLNGTQIDGTTEVKVIVGKKDIKQALDNMGVKTEEIPKATRDELNELTKAQEMYGFSDDDVTTLVKERQWKLQKRGDLTGVMVAELIKAMEAAIEPDDIPF